MGITTGTPCCKLCGPPPADHWLNYSDDFESYDPSYSLTGALFFPSVFPTQYLGAVDDGSGNKVARFTFWPTFSYGKPSIFRNCQFRRSDWAFEFRYIDGIAGDSPLNVFLCYEESGNTPPNFYPGLLFNLTIFPSFMQLALTTPSGAANSLIFASVIPEDVIRVSLTNFQTSGGLTTGDVTVLLNGVVIDNQIGVLSFNWDSKYCSSYYGLVGGSDQGDYFIDDWLLES